MQLIIAGIIGSAHVDFVIMGLSAYGTGNNSYNTLTSTGDKTTLTQFIGLPDGVQINKLAIIDSENTIILGSDGVVYGVGHNFHGQITGAVIDGSSFNLITKEVLTPFTGLPIGVTALDIYCFQYNTLVLGSDGLLYGTGDNPLNMLTGVELHPITGTALTIKTTLTPFTGLPNGVIPVKVYSVSASILVIGSDGVVYGSGSNSYGKLTGSGNRSTLTALTGLPGGVTAVEVYPSSSNTTLVLGSNGLLYGAGFNTNNPLTGSGNKSTLTAFTGLPGGVTVVKVACGQAYNLVLGSNGILYGTGYNGYNQLTGTGVKTTLTAFTGLPGGVTVVDVIINDYSTIVIGSDGLVYGCGRNNYGQLTDSAMTNKTTLTVFTGLPVGVNAVKIYGRASSTCVLGSDGVLYGTGQNTNSVLTGIGNKTTLTPFTGLPGGVTVVDVYLYGTSGTGINRYSIAVLGSDNILYGTGDNSYNQLTGALSTDKTTLTPFTGLPADKVISTVIATYYCTIVLLQI